MKKVYNKNKILLFSLFIFALFLLFNKDNFFTAEASTGSSWLKSQEIIIDHTKVVGGPHTDFPALLTEANFDSDIFINAKDNGCDIRFTTDEAGNTEIAFEQVLFDKSNNNAEFWVKIPLLKGSSNTSIWVWYDNNGALCYDKSDLYGAENVWNNDYKLVTHDTKNDSTSNSNDGVEQGGVSAGGISGKIGQATDFDGSDDYIAMPDNNPVWAPNNNFSISAWINLDSIGSWYETILDVNYAESSSAERESGYIFEYRPTGNLSFKLSTIVETDEDLISSFSFNTNEWYYLTAVRNGTSQEIYINGALDSSRICTSAQIDFDSTTYDDDKINIGRFSRAGNPDDSHLDGKIEELRLASMAKSADWIATEFNNQNSPETFTMSPPSPTLPAEVDCGLRAFDGTDVVTLACEEVGNTTSPLRVGKNGLARGVILVDPSHSDATKFRIQVGADTMAIKKYIPCVTGFDMDFSDLTFPIKFCE